LCCRDHHDGGTGEDDEAGDPGRALYSPFRPSTEYYDGAVSSLTGDHKHFNTDHQGNIVLADSAGDTYLEACRMIRKDGFFRVAQDLRQEGLNTFPANYLDEEGEVGEYSSYVTGSVSNYESAMGATDLYELSPPTLTGPEAMVPAVTFPASTFATATAMPTASGSTEQQLRARGIYIDYMSDDLRAKINCLDVGGTGDACEVPNINSALEIIPFYDVQLTWLTRWNESPNNNPVDVSNEAVKTNNGHTRGKASLQSGFGYSTVSSSVHKGNLGLTGTDPIDPWYTGNEEDYLLYALAYDASSPPPLSGIVISGTISSAVNGVRASDVEITATGAQCDRTNTGYECALEVGANSPRLTISNYDRNNRTLLGCSDVLDIHGSEVSANNWTRFNLPLASISNGDIVIKEDSCL